jgi:acetate kinase
VHVTIWVINCGSSSVKADAVDASTGTRSARFRVTRIGETDGDAPNHATAVQQALGALAEQGPPTAIGHRVVHGAERFVDPTLLDDDAVAAIEALSHLAPLHMPHNLSGIRAAMAAHPDVPHVAVFDTAFHRTLPRRARTYALPQDLIERYSLRRYGFHGPSHAFVAQQAADHLQASLRDLRLITCHLGNGCSVTAVEYGRSVETSMGMTPVEGLVMGTRSGDIDAGVLIDLMRNEGLDADELDGLLNRESGLAGLSGVGKDLRDIEAHAADGDDNCRLAMAVFAHRLRKYIGAYAAVMGGVDAIVFTGGIGENSAGMRQRVAQRLDFLGARLDDDRNRDALVDHTHRVASIGAEHGRCQLLVVASDEAWAIATDVAKVAGAAREEDAHEIPVAISARHVHLTQEAVDALFGPGHSLTPERPLTQPGQFAAVERLTLVGPKRNLEGVRIIGPVRSACQVEISRTDEYHLGLDAPIRCSGDLDNTPGITLRGTGGDYAMTQGVIQSQRHIHMTPDDAAHFGVGHKEIVEVAVNSEGRDLVFRDVVVRVKDSYKLEMHVDTDEGNAAEVTRDLCGVLIETRESVRMRRR